MTQHYYYQGYPMGYAPEHQTAYQQELNMLMEAAKTGAIIGGTGAAAYQMHRYHNEGVSWQEAATGTVKGALQVSVAATAATAVGHMFGGNKALSLAATLVTGTAVMYALTKPKEEDNA